MSDKSSNHQLSTPVYKHLNGVESWNSADKDTRIAFYGAMKGRAYGREPTLDAWNWFLTGRTSRPADETTDQPVAWMTTDDPPRVASAWSREGMHEPMKEVFCIPLYRSSPEEPSGVCECRDTVATRIGYNLQCSQCGKPIRKVNGSRDG